MISGYYGWLRIDIIFDYSLSPLGLGLFTKVMIQDAKTWPTKIAKRSQIVSSLREQAVCSVFSPQPETLDSPAAALLSLAPQLAPFLQARTHPPACAPPPTDLRAAMANRKGLPKPFLCLALVILYG